MSPVFEQCMIHGLGDFEGIKLCHFPDRHECLEKVSKRDCSKSYLGIFAIIFCVLTSVKVRICRPIKFHMKISV